MLNKVFNVQNPFWQFMSVIFDLFLLNIMWLISCIPLITIGPATTAAFYTLIQRERKEDTSLWKDYVHSFKTNLRQGMLIGILVTLLGAFLALDIYMCRISGHGIYTFFMFFFGIIFIFWAITSLYIFPILAKFERKTKDIFIWAFTLSIKNITSTFTMMLVIVAGLWMCHILPGLIFIMFGLIFQYCATVCTGIFKPYLPKPWYLEDPDYQAEHNIKPDQTYSDFDEASFYGYDPKEVEKLLHEDSEK